MAFLEKKHMTAKHNPIFCAVDKATLADAKKLAGQLRGHVYGLKLGLEFFMAQGAPGYKALQQEGLPLFLDVKLHDIPNTVAGAISSLAPLHPDFITIHTSGGRAMMEAAKQALLKADASGTKLLGVTVLTSMDTADLEAVGQDKGVAGQVIRLARLAQESGLDGVICSPAEIEALRKACGPDFILMVPGIRPEGTVNQDQKRVMTPHEAVNAGATYLVIGRPITGDANPAEAARRIMATL